MAERWSDPAPEGPLSRSTPRSIQRGSDALEQGIDRLMSAGRQLVDGVSGARPGSRKASRAAGPGPGVRPRLGELGRWVEDKLDWILEDDDDWREPWQEPREPQRPPGWRPPAQSIQQPPARNQPLEPPVRSSARRRPLEAISRRSPLTPPAAAAAPVAPAPSTWSSPPDDDWPDDDSFTRPRWQRSPVQVAQPAPSLPDSVAARSLQDGSVPGSRPMPRSSRRRQVD